jgi:hypothetical protein
MFRLFEKNILLHGTGVGKGPLSDIFYGFNAYVEDEDKQALTGCEDLLATRLENCALAG